MYDNLAIFPSDEEVHIRLRELSKRYPTSFELPKETVKKRRSILLDELLQEYFLERILERKKPMHLEVLSSQILDETLRIVLGLNLSTEPARPTPASEPTKENMIVTRAIRHIEANLFSPMTSKEIAQNSRSSGATLFRQFQKELKMSPGEYIARRRLDEALALLRTGTYTLTDIALIVGYSDLAAFSKAFKARFGKAPSLLIG